MIEASCKANYKGSAGSMEVASATKIFQLSVEKHRVCYISYYGDGDSKSYEEVKIVYPGITVEKYENVFMAIRKIQMEALIQPYGEGHQKLYIVDYIL